MRRQRPGEHAGSVVNGEAKIDVKYQRHGRTSAGRGDNDGVNMEFFIVEQTKTDQHFRFLLERSPAPSRWELLGRQRTYASSQGKIIAELGPQKYRRFSFPLKFIRE